MESRYIKTDDNKVIQEKHIRWIKKVNDCLNICTKGTGCATKDTHQVCKLYTPNSYAKLNKLFE